VDRHVGWVLQRVARRLASRPDAEDLVQEILLAAYQQLPELRDPERFGAWLAGIADNKLRMWHRRQALQLRWLEANGEDVVEGARAEAPEDRAVRSLVRRAVGRLTPVQREVVVQHYLKGYSYQQVAGFLGVGTGTVRSRLQKARRRLQQEVMDMPESMLGPMQFELKGRDARALRSAIEFVSRDPTRPILQSVLLDAGGWLVATDGSALFRWRAEGLTALAAPVVLGPWPGLDLPGQAAPVTLSLEEEAATLSTGKTEVVVGVMEGPYVKYEEAVGDPGPIVATMRGAEFQASLVELETFLAPKHPLAGLGGWSYRPFVRVSLSSVEQSLTMSTTRDLGYDSPLQREKGLPTEVAGPDWEFSTDRHLRVPRWPSPKWLCFVIRGL